ncbi:MAG: YjdF family protein [Prevotella sp.]|nr:YjdF family protein [Prevotella sp.]
MTTGSLTVLFEDSFWIGLFEIIDQMGLRACKVTFGAEPTEKEVMEFIDKNWNRLQFSQAVEVPVELEKAKVNPKRRLREAKKQTQSQGIGSKSQQALKLQQEQSSLVVSAIRSA